MRSTEQLRQYRDEIASVTGARSTSTTDLIDALLDGDESLRSRVEGICDDIDRDVERCGDGFGN